MTETRPPIAAPDPGAGQGDAVSGTEPAAAALRRRIGELEARLDRRFDELGTLGLLFVEQRQAFEARQAALTGDLAAAAADAERLDRRLAGAEERARHAEAARAAALAEVAAARAAMRAATDAAADAGQALAALRASTSWRATAPLRALGRLFRRR